MHIIKLTYSLNIGADVTCLCPRFDIWYKALHMIKLFLRNGKTKLILKCFCIALFGSIIKYLVPYLGTNFQFCFVEMPSQKVWSTRLSFHLWKPQVSWMIIQESLHTNQMAHQAGVYSSSLAWSNYEYSYPPPPWMGC